MTESSPISLVCLDLAGIVIDDSVVERAFAEAIATQGIVAGNAGLRPVHGPVRPVPRAAARRRAARAVRGRRAAGPGGVARVRPLVPRGRAAVRRQRPGRRSPTRSARRRARVPRSCLITVLSRSRLRRPARPRSAMADLVLCADDVPRSFPWPDPVLTAMLRLGTGDVREVAVVSATEDGVLSGYRAGAGPGRGHRLRRPPGGGAARGGRHPRARQHRGARRPGHGVLGAAAAA